MEIVVVLRFVVGFFPLVLQVQLLLQLLYDLQVVDRLWWLVQLGFLLFCDIYYEGSALDLMGSNNLFHRCGVQCSCLAW